jgi:hypothetical protein
MARPKVMKFYKTNTSRPLDQSCSQPLLNDRLKAEDQLNTQLSANSSFASTSCSFLSANNTSLNNTNITKPIDDSTLVEPIQVNQDVLVAETQVQLEVELTNKARNAIVETRVVSAN